MLTAIVVLVLLWLIGMVAAVKLGGFLHGLLILAIAVLLVRTARKDGEIL